MDQLEGELRTAFPGRDIRHDPGDGIQIIASDIAVEVMEIDDGYSAKVVVLKTDPGFDFESRLIETIRAKTRAVLIGKLAQYLH